MYPKNSASPPQIAIGPVVQISDGAVQTSGCTVRIIPLGVAEGDGGGTTAYSTDGVVLYTPTQAETNYASFILIAKKSGCIPSCVTVVTTATSTTGTVVVTTNNDKTGYTASTVSDKTGYSLTATTGLGNQTANISGTITTVTNLTNAPSDSSGITTLLNRLTATRAGYLDQLEHIHDDTDGNNTKLNTIIGYIDTEIAAILAAVDTEVAAIKAKTDSLTFTVAGDVDVNVQSWKGSTAADMTGDAFARLGAPAGASVSADIAAIEAQTDDIGVAGAGLTAVPWNSAWDAEVQSEATDALNAYDPPTKDEMDSAIAEISITGGDATLANQQTIISMLNSVGGVAGSGAITWTYTLTEQGSGDPIGDADVWVTTDLAGSNIIASGKTNQSGVMTFYLDAGTVYIWKQKSGWNFTNPDTETVS